MKLPPKKKGVSEQLLKLIAYNPLHGLHKPPKFKKRARGGRLRRAEGGSADDNSDSSPIVVNRPFGELSAGPAPSPTQWLGNKFQDAMEYAGAKPDVARHLREGIGGVLGMSPLGIAGSAVDAVDAKARGDNAGTVQAMAGMLPGVGPEARAAAREASSVLRVPKPPAGTKPVIPLTDWDMIRSSRVEDVPLSKVSSGQTDKDMRWDETNRGVYGKPQIPGYGDKPVAVKMPDGTYHLQDGNHRTALALQRGDEDMPMHVIDHNAYDSGVEVPPPALGTPTFKYAEHYPDSKIVYVDPAKFDDAWQANRNMHVGELGQGKGADVSKYARAKSFFASGPKEFEAPEVSINSKGMPTFVDGRHRFAAMRDMGYDSVPVVMDANAFENASKHGLITKQNRASGGSVQHLADGGIPAFDEARGADAVPAFDEARGPDQDVGKLAATWSGAKQGATFGFADELAGLQGAAPEWVDKVPLVGPVARPMVGAARLASGYLTGDSGASDEYTKARDEARTADEQAKAQHPYLHMAGEIAGSIPAMAVLPGGELAQGANFATKIVKGAQVGAEYGALSGLGEGKDVADSALKSAEGIVGGIVGGAAAPVVGAGLSHVADRVISPAVGAVRAIINPEGEASRRLVAALQKDQEMIAGGKADGMTWQQWTQAKAAGEPVTLADLGSSNTQALLRSSANTSPEGRAVLEKTINDRFAGQTERVADEVRGLVAGGANAGKTGEELVDAYNKGRVPAYRKAYSEGDKEIVSPTIERLMGSPLFEDAMKKAVVSGKDRAITEGYGAFNPGVMIENGMIKFTKTKPNGVPQYPNLQYWDSVKKELDSVANIAKRQGDNERYSVASNMAKTLRGELDTQVPSYGDARGIAAQFFGENNALEAGQKLAGKKVDPAEIAGLMKKMKPDEKKLFQEGYASDWANRVIGNMSDSRDITKAMFNSPNERARALAVFGVDGLSKMEARMSLETIMDGARKAMGNSTTARQLIEAGLAGGTLSGYLTGWDPTKMAEGAGVAAGARRFLGSEMAAGARRLIGKVDAKTARTVAELLTSNDPTKLAQGMRMAQKNQRISEGLKNIANRVSLGTQAPQSGAGARLMISPWQGPGMAPGRTNDEQQKPVGPIN